MKGMGSLMDGSGSRTAIPRILLIYRRMTPSVRLCGHEQFDFLEKKGLIAYRPVQEMRLSVKDLDWADTVVLGRTDSWYEHRLAEKLKKTGKYLVYILDDDLLNIPGEIASAGNFGRKKVREYIRDMIGWSDAILSPSPLLLEKYAGGKKPIRVEEPAVLPAPYKAHAQGGQVKIGFAGSPDRTEDLESILREALTAVKTEYGSRVKIEFFGAEPSFAKEIGAECIPWTDSYDRYRETLNSLEWDIGLAPMPDTPFHACKHYNKFTEYAAAGIAGVFSEAGPYRRLDAFSAGAVLCGNKAAEWTDAIRSLVEDDGRRERIRKNAAAYAADELSVRRCAEALYPEIRECVNPDAKRMRGVLFPLKAVNIGKRFVSVLQGRGIRGFLKTAFVRIRRG